MRFFTVDFTVRVMGDSKTVKTWEKTRVQFLLRHKSGGYYARCYAGGEEHWENLETVHFRVAQAKLPEVLKKIRTAARKTDGTGKKKKMTFGDTAKVFMRKPTRDADAKTSTFEYVKEVLAAIYRSWPGLEEREIKRISSSECAEWAAGFSEKYSATRFNAGLSVMRRIFEIAKVEGVRFDNPTDENISRRKVRSKIPALPSTVKFTEFVKEMAGAGGRFSQACADFVQGLAFTGMRRGEAKWLAWQHLDFKADRIRVLGDPVEGTKNREERIVPMISDAKQLFTRMRNERSEEPPTDAVFMVNEAQKAMDRAAGVVGMERITHHDLRHLFATACIEAGVDIPTLSRWLGHKDGGALAMRTYGHLRDEHSARQAARVSFGSTTVN